MSDKNYPTRKELEKLWWFRIGIILKWLILIFALFSPLVIGGLWYFDGVINVLIWYIVIQIVFKIVRYIVYGKAPVGKDLKEETKKDIEEFAAIFLFGGMLLLLVWVLR